MIVFIQEAPIAMGVLPYWTIPDVLGPAGFIGDPEFILEKPFLVKSVHI